jgi:hypothetical protein
MSLYPKVEEAIQLGWFVKIKESNLKGRVFSITRGDQGQFAVLLTNGETARFPTSAWAFYVTKLEKRS